MSKRIGPALSALLLGVVAVFLVWPSGDAAVDQQAENSSASAQSQDSEPETSSDSETEFVQFSDLPAVTRAELPAEAIDTLSDIADGGPYDFSKDDSTFQNREGYLPDRDRGHYREYTVITPGSSDRGARRIVAGADGELYYTDDHYNSFREVVQ